MVHISKIAKERVEHVEDYLTLGDKVKLNALEKTRWEEWVSQSKMLNNIF